MLELTVFPLEPQWITLENHFILGVAQLEDAVEYNFTKII